MPFVGNMPQLKKLSKKLGGLHLAMSELAKEHKTNVLGLKFGSDYMVIVFSYPLIRQVLRAEEYESRPDSFFVRLRSMGTKKGVTCTDGEFWNIQRNFVVRHLRNLGFGRSSMDVMILDELQEMLGILGQPTNGEGFFMPRIFSPAVINILWALTAGNRISRKDARLQKLLDLFNRRSKLFDLSGGLLTQFPLLRFIAPEMTGYNLIVEFNKELKEFFMETINAHKENWVEDKEDDLIYAFISEMRKENCDPSFTDDQLVMICLDIFVAGAETTSNTLSFAILMMILHPQIQDKVHTCLDSVFSNKKVPRYFERNMVPYVEAVLLEVERFCYVVPLTGPRRVLTDTVIDGYNIPKNATVLLNNHSVHHDPNIWGDPENFRPERFLDDKGQILNNEHLIPFNFGEYIVVLSSNI